MIAVDTNLLVYAHYRDMPFHKAAREAIERLVERNALWSIPWPCVHEFLSIVTNPRIFKRPTSMARALDHIDIWREAPTLVFLTETAEYWTELRALLRASHVTGPLVHDARVAALCLSHGVRELWTADRDFSRFPHLRVRNPLIA